MSIKFIKGGKNNGQHHERKITIIDRGLTSIFIVICFLLSLIQSQEAYAEMKKISGTSKCVTKLIKDETYYDPTRVRFENSLRVFSSAVPDWDKAKVFNLTYSITPTYQGDDCSGYAAITHPNGDQMFIKYDGSWKWVLPRDACRWNGESKSQFIGGIGKFEGIKGVYTSNLKGDGKSSTGEWEVEYEIASICSRSCSSGWATGVVLVRKLTSMYQQESSCPFYQAGHML